jgi:hypothetical protein
VKNNQTILDLEFTSKLIKELENKQIIEVEKNKVAKKTNF